MARAVEEPSAGVEHCQRDHERSSEGGVTPDGAIIRGRWLVRCGRRHANGLPRPRIDQSAAQALNISPRSGDVDVRSLAEYLRHGAEHRWMFDVAGWTVVTKASVHTRDPHISVKTIQT